MDKDTAETDVEAVSEEAPARNNTAEAMQEEATTGSPQEEEASKDNATGMEHEAEAEEGTAEVAAGSSSWPRRPRAVSNSTSIAFLAFGLEDSIIVFCCSRYRCNNSLLRRVQDLSVPHISLDVGIITSAANRSAQRQRTKKNCM